MSQPPRTPGDEPEFTVPIPLDAEDSATREMPVPYAAGRGADVADDTQMLPFAGPPSSPELESFTDPYVEPESERRGPSWFARLGSALCWMSIGGLVLLGLRVGRWTLDGEVDQSSSPRAVLRRIVDTFPDEVRGLAVLSAVATIILFASRGRRWLGVLSLLVTLLTWAMALDLVRFVLR